MKHLFQISCRLWAETKQGNYGPYQVIHMEPVRGEQALEMEYGPGDTRFLHSGSHANQMVVNNFAQAVPLINFRDYCNGLEQEDIFQRRILPTHRLTLFRGPKGYWELERMPELIEPAVEPPETMPVFEGGIFEKAGKAMAWKREIKEKYKPLTR